MFRSVNRMTRLSTISKVNSNLTRSIHIPNIKLKNSTNYYSTNMKYTKSPMSEEIKPGCKCSSKEDKVEKSEREMGPLESALDHKIKTELNPTILTIRNDSWKHAHHSGMKGAENVIESHFHVTIVSDKFSEPSLKGALARHRYIFKLLDDEVKKIHGFQVVCKTPTEWEKINEKTIPRTSSSQYFQ